LETLHGLLVIKNGHRITEGYFNGGAADRKDNRQSVTKSFVSAAALWEAFWPGDYMPLIVHFPLTSDPGTELNYSNLTSH
jgi:hypothetical protein